MTDHPSTLRILDANFNRAREALRVMEDFARFELDDALLTEACKTLRHALAEAVWRADGISNTAEQDPPRPPFTTAPLFRSTSGRLGSGSPARAGSGGSPDAPRSAVGKKGGESAPESSTTPFRVGLGSDGSARTEVRGSLTAFRDIVGDVGREVTAPGEFRRADAADVAVAAARRLSEALRSIEEYGKTLPAIGSDFAAAIETLRYRGYEIERRLALTVRAKEKFGGVRLYVIISEAFCRTDWFATAEAVLEGGADCLQLREKDLPDRELLARAKRLAVLCRKRERMLIINDRPDIAAAAGAHGVHLGQDDLPIAAARRILPPWAVVGKSTHTPEQIETAAAEAPDYLAVGPMFPSRTKAQEHIAGPEALRSASALTSSPLVAIGGIDEANAQDLLAIGPVCLCVCGAIISGPDPGLAARRFRQIIGPTRTTDTR